jgi:hypothetical protein
VGTPGETYRHVGFIAVIRYDPDVADGGIMSDSDATLQQLRIVDWRQVL